MTYLEWEARHLPPVGAVLASSVPDVVTVTPRIDVALIHAALGDEPFLAGGARNAALADAHSMPVVQTGAVSLVVVVSSGDFSSAARVV